MGVKTRVALLSTAAINEALLGGARDSDLVEVVGVGSRDRARAAAYARERGIERAYGSYDELLADPELDAVYVALPNALHVEWAIRALEAGKHVLCEKPIGLNADEARTLLAARDRTGVKIQEAFMVRTHPQWLAVREDVRSGRIGELRAIQMAFSYFNRDPANVRNKADIGGGALMDIGCYPVVLCRFLFGEEPARVIASIDRDPEFGTDRLTSALLEFRGGQSAFTCSTQLVPYQRMQVLGTKGRIEVEIPVNAPPDRPCRIFFDDGRDALGSGVETRTFEVCNQYTLQADQVSRAIREGRPAPEPLEDAVANMEVIDALFRSAGSGTWERPGPGA
jgi:predicted dehydrogenase